LAAIELDDEVALTTGEVGDIGADLLLPYELEAEKPPIPQMVPELAFRIGGACPQ
jgi:hypothetical protein